MFFSVFGLKGPLCTVLGGPGGHVGVIFRNATNPTMKKSRFTKCVFLVFWPLRAVVYCFGGPWRACWGHLQERHEPNNEKNTFYKVWFFRFLAFRAIVYCFGGALKGMLGSSEKNHVLQSVFFSFFGL